MAFPQIATYDIGKAVAKALTEKTQEYEVRELLGPRDLSLAEAAKILGERIGNA